MNVHQILLSSWRVKGGSGYETICDLDVDEISATDQDQESGLIMHAPINVTPYWTDDGDYMGGD